MVDDATGSRYRCGTCFPRWQRRHRQQQQQQQLLLFLRLLLLFLQLQSCVCAFLRARHARAATHSGTHSIILAFEFNKGEACLDSNFTDSSVTAHHAVMLHILPRMPIARPATHAPEERVWHQQTPVHDFENRQRLGGGKQQRQAWSKQGRLAPGAGGVETG